MIKAVFYCTDEKKIQAFEMSGHADSGPYGHDIVCAAASGLSISTLNNLERLLNVTPALEADHENGGYLKAELHDLPEETEAFAQLLLKHLYYSLLDVSEEYADHIQVVIHKV